MTTSDTRPEPAGGVEGELTNAQLVRAVDALCCACTKLSMTNKELQRLRAEEKAELELLREENGRVTLLNAQVTSLNEALQVSKVDMNTEMDRLLEENDALRATLGGQK